MTTTAPTPIVGSLATPLLWSPADPSTSRDAARNHVASGACQRHRDIVYAAMAANPDCTSAELAEKCGLERHEVARRASDLRTLGRAVQGYKRICKVNGTKAVTWRAVA